jgi:hypothetical protein
MFVKNIVSAATTTVAQNVRNMDEEEMEKSALIFWREKLEKQKELMDAHLKAQQPVTTTTVSWSVKKNKLEQQLSMKVWNVINGDLVTVKNFRDHSSDSLIECFREWQRVGGEGSWLEIFLMNVLVAGGPVDEFDRLLKKSIPKSLQSVHDEAISLQYNYNDAKLTAEMANYKDYLEEISEESW